MMDLLVTGAADWELAPLIDSLVGRRQERHGIWTCWLGAIGRQSVAVVRTDWGPINAVAATLKAIEAFRPAAMLCQGMAGAHNPDLLPGDIVAGVRAVDYSAYKSAPDGTRAPLAHRLRVDSGEMREFASFTADPALLLWALTGHNPYGRVIAGVVGSAYQYNREVEAIRAIRGLYKTDCEDMESAFAAGAAAIVGVPFVAVRMISNSEFTSPQLDKRAGERCAQHCVDLITSRVG